MKYQAKIIQGGDVASVTNELNKLLESVDKIISVTQSNSSGRLYLTVIFTLKEGGKIPLNESQDSYDVGEH